MKWSALVVLGLIAALFACGNSDEPASDPAAAAPEASAPAERPVVRYYTIADA